MGSIKLATSVLLIFVAPWKINGESLTDADIKFDDVFRETKVSYPLSFISQGRETQFDNFRQHKRNVNQRSNKKIPNKQWQGHQVTCTSSCGPSMCIQDPPNPGSISGTIQSRWYPLDYGTNLDCLYTLTVNKPGCTLFLSFVDFVVEENFDFVTVSTPQVSYPRYTGYNLPPLMHTQGLQMTVRFTADCSNCKIPTGYGKWQAKYRLICPTKPNGLPAQKKNSNRSLVRAKTN